MIEILVDVLFPVLLCLFHELIILQYVFDRSLDFLCRANQFLLLLLCDSFKFELYSGWHLNNCFQTRKPWSPISAVCPPLFARLWEVLVLLEVEGQISGVRILESASYEPVRKPGKRLEIFALLTLVVTIFVMQSNVILLDPIKQLFQIFGIRVFLR